MAANDTNRPIRLLHLSDIHFRAGRTWDSDPVLRALVRFIGKEVQGGRGPDLVAITGDLAFAGTAAEYGLALEWLEQHLWPVFAPALPRDRLLLVPGNHDVDRGLLSQGVRFLQDRLLDERSQNVVTDLLRDDHERRGLLRRHDAYLAFYSHWLGAAQALPWWQRTIPIDGQHLHLAGLDSAWMACGDTDRGRLLLGRRQLNQTVLHPDADGADWRLALLHHPWDYLAEFDAHEARQTIHLKCDLVLRGHLHVGDASYVRPPDPARACLELAAGCIYDGSHHPNAFQWIELRPQTRATPRRVRVLFRHWHQGAWAIDRNQPGCPDGTAEFPLSRTTTDPLTPPTRTRRARIARSAGSDRPPGPAKARAAIVDTVVGPGSRLPQPLTIQEAAPDTASAARIAEDAEPPLDDSAFNRHWQAFRDRNRQEVAAALAKSPVLLQALSVQLAQIGHCPGLDADARSDTERARGCADGLLDLDFDAFAGVAVALYRQLRDAADTAGRSAGDERGACDTLLDIMLRLAPLLYDSQLARTTYVARGAHVVEVPAALYAVAELAMAAEESRATAYQRRKGPAGDDLHGLACLSAAMPELGINASTDDYCERFLVHLGRKDLAREAFRKDRFLHDWDRFMEHFYPRGRTPHGSSDEELLADRRCAVDAELPKWPEQRRGRPFHLYTVFRPETLEELQEMRETAEELHRRYPRLRILFLTASRRDAGGDHRWDLEMARLKDFCRILRFHD